MQDKKNLVFYIIRLKEDSSICSDKADADKSGMVEDLWEQVHSSVGPKIKIMLKAS